MLPSLKKSLLIPFIFFVVFFAISLSIVSCSKNINNIQKKNWNTSPENKLKIESLFHYIMLEEHAIFTLCGSKPITEITINHYTDEQIQAYYDSLTEEEKQNCCMIERTYDMAECWEEWKKICHQLPFRHYMLFESNWYNDPEVTFIYFVNIASTTSLLQKHYQVFRNVVGFDFDPEKVVFEMQNQTSPFWDKVNGSALLWGLLFGFGEENSTIFHKKHFECKEHEKTLYDSIPTKDSNTFPTGLIKFDLNNFLIPSFVSFEKDDQTINKYIKEKEEIQKIYKGQDFLDVTLTRLTNN